MPQYIEFNGETIEFPDNMSDAQIAAALRGQAAPTPAVAIPGQAAKAPLTQQEAPSMMEQMFGAGSPIARTIKGAIVDPALAVNQMLANTGLFGQDIKAGANRLVQQSEKMTEEGRARVGSTGFDPYQLLGGVVSPVNKLIGVAQAPAAAAGLASKVGSSAATGAGLAAFQPVTGEGKDFAESKLEQMTVGAILGPITEGGVKAVGALANLVKGLTPSGREAALKKYVDNLAGEDKTKVITALQDAKELVSGSRPTVAEALSDIPSAVELLAAQKKLSTKSGQAAKFAERSAEQQAARVRAIQEIAKTEAERTKLALERGEVTGELRDRAIAQADEAQNIINGIDKQVKDRAGQLVRQAEEASNLPYPQLNFSVQEQTRALRETADQTASQLKQLQLTSLAESGVFPLKASDIAEQIDKAIKGTSSDLSKQVLEFAKQKILSKADDNGILSSQDLYDNVRKTLNQDIEAFLQQGQKFAQGGLPQQAAKTAGNVKSFIDTALDRSSGGAWKKYLESYTDYSNKLNRMEIGDYLSKKLQTPLDKERAGVFATAVENAAGTIKQATGIPRYEKLSEILTPREVAVVNSVLDDLKRTTQAAQGARKVSTLPEGQVDVTKEIPSLLSRTVSILRAGVEQLQRGNAKEFNNRMTELMLDPKGLALYMSTDLKKGKVNDFVSSLMKVMDEPTRAAFIQSFTVPQAASLAGQ
jgi:hypothetical protein